MLFTYLLLNLIVWKNHDFWVPWWLFLVLRFCREPLEKIMIFFVIFQGFKEIFQPYLEWLESWMIPLFLGFLKSENMIRVLFQWFVFKFWAYCRKMILNFGDFFRKITQMGRIMNVTTFFRFWGSENIILVLFQWFVVKFWLYCQKGFLF